MASNGAPASSEVEALVGLEPEPECPGEATPPSSKRVSIAQSTKSNDHPFGQGRDDALSKMRSRPLTRRSSVEIIRDHPRSCERMPETKQGWPPKSWSPQCRSPITSHKHAINSCFAFEHDSHGPCVLSCDEDGALRLTDLASGRLNQEVGNHGGAAKDCCVLRDRRRALSCGACDGYPHIKEYPKLKIWQLDTGEELRMGKSEWDDTSIMHKNTVNAICTFIVDGDTGSKTETKERALTASEDGTLKVWDLDKRSLIATLTCTDKDGKEENGKEEKSGVKSCCVFTTSEGRLQALSGGADNHVRRWDLSRALQALDTKGTETWYEIKHKDSGSSAWPEDRTGSPWMAKQAANKTGHHGIVNACCASADGKRALTCSGDRKAIFWELTTGTEIRTLRHVSSVFSCCFLDGEKLALTASSFAPRLWDVHSGECLRIFAGHTGDVLHCTISSCGKALTCGKGGSIRVWELSAHDNNVKLGSDEEGYQQHKHIVKEIVAFPDGTKAVSCSYDKTAKVWCLRTGRCLATLTGHNGHNGRVYECCIFPDEQKLLTGSADGTIKIWGPTSEVVDGQRKINYSNYECQQTLGQSSHGEIRGCGVFADGQKAFSCSKNGSIYIFDLTLETASDGTHKSWVPSSQVVTGGQMVKKLSGHTEHVDRCAVFCKSTRMISASWDNTCKIWNLQTGECLHTCKDENKVRGVAVYDNGSKAVCCGSGAWISIWDIETGIQVNRWRHKHTSTVWGLQLLDHLLPLERNGTWVESHVAMTYSGDGFVKLWDLDHDGHKSRTVKTDYHNFEIVHARRAFDPAPMCVAVLPPSYEFGKFALLVGGHKSIQMNDVSTIGSCASAGAIWAGKTACGDPNTWNEWVVEAVRETSPHFLYFCDQKSPELPTLIHKLASDLDGYRVLHKLVDGFENERAAIKRGEGDRSKHGGALATIGMLSRAGTTAPRPAPGQSATTECGSALNVAVKHSNESVIQLLLDDYRDHIALCDAARVKLAATLVLELTEAEMVDLYAIFPMLAADFLRELPMQMTPLVAQNSKCDFAATDHKMFVKAHDEHSPPETRGDDGQFVRYWDKIIDEQWKNSKPTKQSRVDDTAWGVKVIAERVPLVAGGFEKESEKLSPPFSRLLKAACDHASKTKNVRTFESMALRAIVQYKWEDQVQNMYHTMVWGYAAHIACFTTVSVKFEDWAECYSPGTFYVDVNTTHLNHIFTSGQHIAGENVGAYGLWAYPCITLDAEGEKIEAYDADGSSWGGWLLLGWMMGAYSTVYIGVMLRHEYKQARQDGRKYLSDFWNLLDLASAGFALLSIILLLIYYMTAESNTRNLRVLDVIQAHGLLLGWIKVLYFLRGLDQTSSIVYMLLSISQSMAPFMIVLLVVLIAFATSFQLMLRHDLVKPDKPNGEEEETMFDTTATSLLGVWGMMFGDFEVTEFRQALSDSDLTISGIQSSWISLIDLTLFLAVVPLVMLNAVIAIMSDTYTNVKPLKEASQVQNRACLILEMEGQMAWAGGGHDQAKKSEPTAICLSRKCCSKSALRNLFSMSILFEKYPRYLHLLAQQTHRVDESEDTSAQVDRLGSNTTYLMDQFDSEARSANLRQAQTTNVLEDMKKQMDEMQQKCETASALEDMKKQMDEMKREHAKFREEMLALLRSGAAPKPQPELESEPEQPEPDQKTELKPEAEAELP